MWTGARGALALLVVLLACGGGNVGPRRPPTLPPAPACGDGTVDEGEECDGSNLAAQSCSGLGFEAGTLACSSTCSWDTSACTRRCGNGSLDPGEACDGTLGPLACASWGFKACSASCQVEATHCVAEAFAARQDVAFEEGGPAILADLSPTGAGELVVAVKDYRDSGFGILTIRRWERGEGFSSGSTLDVERAPARVLAADLDGDGATDLAAMNTDGSVDRYRYVPAEGRYAHTPLLEWLACNEASDLVGTLPALEGPGRVLVTFGCPTGAPPTPHRTLQVIHAGESGVDQTLEAMGVVDAEVADLDGDGVEELLWMTSEAATLYTWRREGLDWVTGPEYTLPAPARHLAAGDLDGDGRVDVALGDGTNVTLLQHTGTGLAPARTLPGSGTFLTLVDVDGDGRRDVAWVDGASVQVARNGGDFTFASQSLAGGEGTPLSLSFGDADGDGDVDLAASYSDASGPRASRTGLFLNQAR